MKSVYDRLCDTLRNRVDWENRQRVWYMMRHQGLPRINKPWPNAADLHWPLIDGTIDKFKPFYYNQIFQGERIAEFSALAQQAQSACQSAADYFNWEVRQNSNFEMEILTVIDQMELRAKGICKVFFDPFKEKLTFVERDPQYFIIPGNANSIEEADFFADVLRLSVAQYLRDPRYQKNDADTIRQIVGSKDYTNQSNAEQEKLYREGLTYLTNDEEILIWEEYEKMQEGWRVKTYSPMKPAMELRAPYMVTNKMTDPLTGKTSAFVPYVSFQMEIKDKGWYSPRGLAERLAPFEQVMSKLWNDKADYMTFVNKPMFTSDDPVPPNMTNYKIGPGELLPRGIKPMEQKALPIDIDQEMLNQRMVAEQYIQLPSAGLAQDPAKGGQKGDVTATQVNYQATLSGNDIDLKARIFRRSLAELYRKSWAILVQHKKDKIVYFIAGDSKELPQEAMAEIYQIEPDGSPDSWDKGKRIQRAIARKQLFQGDPGINQEELNKDVLSADDPRLIKTLIIPQGQKAANEADAEALMLPTIAEGYQPQIRPDEDHATRIQILMGYLQKQEQAGAHPDPIAIQRVMERIQAHLKMWQETDAKGAAQFMQQMAQQQAQQQAPSNVQQMPPNQELPPQATA